MIQNSARAFRIFLLGLGAIIGGPTARAVHAQSLDWAYGFGPTGNGLDFAARCMTVFNDCQVQRNPSAFDAAKAEGLS